jgi:hypothetical protein
MRRLGTSRYTQTKNLLLMSPRRVKLGLLSFGKVLFGELTFCQEKTKDERRMQMNPMRSKGLPYKTLLSSKIIQRRSKLERLSVSLTSTIN